MSFDLFNKITLPRNAIIAMAVIFAVMMADPIYATEIDAGKTRFDYSNMGQRTLLKVIEVLKSQIDVIVKARDKYKCGVDQEYAEMQKKIEELEVECALAHKLWLERDKGGN